MKTFITILLTVHGILHLPGFFRAFNLAFETELKKNISKTIGIIWMICCLLFIATAVLFYLQVPFWWIFSGISVLISQYVIITSWQVAKTGTFVNLLIAIMTILYITIYQMSQMNLNMQV